MTGHATIETPLGDLTAVVAEPASGLGEVLIGLYFPDHATRPDRSDWGEPIGADSPLLTATGDWLAAAITGAPTPPAPAYELRGNDFQRRVWALLERIPRGATRTYGELAAELGVRNAQLVGQAVGHNPLSILVPCHRVIGADGSLTGYAGGLARKEALLRAEGALPDTLFGEVNA